MMHSLTNNRSNQSLTGVIFVTLKTSIIVGLFVSISLIAQAMEATKEEQLDLAETYSIKAERFYQQGQFEQALTSWENAFHIQSQILDDKHPQVIESLNELAILSKSLNRLNDALIWFHKIYALDREMLGDANLVTLRSLKELALIYYELGRYQEALLWFKKHYHFTRQLLGEEHQQTLNSLDWLALIYSELKSYQKEALPVFEKAIPLEKAKPLQAMQEWLEEQARLEEELTHLEYKAISRKGSDGAVEEPTYITLKVFYATDRDKGQGDPEDNPNQFFNAKRGILSYGTCEVTVPQTHEIGEMERPSSWKIWTREDPTEHIVLFKISEKGKNKYFQELTQVIKESKRKSALVFVHGYNVSFAEAARRTTQMAYDLHFEGAPVFYSWPSDSSWLYDLGFLFKYITAESNAKWTQSHFKSFLKEFVKQSQAENIYLIAHSMGNRVLTETIKELTEEQASIKFTAIILAAPDIDAEVFKRDIAPQITQSSSSVTLYTSPKDRALKISKKLHEYPRAGETQSRIWHDLKNIEVIDTSNADTSFLGHSYYSSSKLILEDIRQLIQGITPTNRIFQEGYWKFKSDN